LEKLIAGILPTEDVMKKLFLAGIATLFLATGAAHAERIPPPDHSKCTNCRNAAANELANHSCNFTGLKPAFLLGSSQSCAHPQTVLS